LRQPVRHQQGIKPMKMPHAIFGSALVIAIAIVVSSFTPAESQQRRADGFMVASDGRALVWRVNTTTGAISYCARQSDSISPGALAESTPNCSRFSAPVVP